MFLNGITFSNREVLQGEAAILITELELLRGRFFFFFFFIIWRQAGCLHALKSPNMSFMKGVTLTKELILRASTQHHPPVFAFLPPTTDFFFFFLIHC